MRENHLIRAETRESREPERRGRDLTREKKRRFA